MKATPETSEGFPPIETILPHRGTMLLLDGVSACGDETLTAYTAVRGDAWYADESGAMPAWIGIELMAQGVAAHIALLAMRAGGRARPGVLLGTRSYKAHASAFARGAHLTVNVQEVLRGDEGHSAYECAIDHLGARYADAVIKVFQPGDFHTFIEGSISS
ncbi:hotdog family protein [Paraburkholderia phymatum]|uniref:Beta-hydroxyacyl-(Acyl-carrier-protein) dehydratase FabA/FabZ n=1 Tax=Paraburkholderia phymatum (strain DSM 17167 / CIP 108236 / LMG 21445 / STM815) TaxID=391038 RepID=B2JEW1_PARP8|nr:hotdog family protein [Paraburkholderia phymatum]ACC69890.1 Beta-hydroxyacyl-(acyl-carrier-protein) dehydratase FabA/FabZ [Paraburkholderia phymatum STM815]